MRHIRSITVAVAILLPAAATAQRLEPLGARVATHQSRAGQQTRAGAPTRTYQLSMRMVLGVGSAFAGAFGGALAGANGPTSDCNCDDPGLREAIYGAMIGSVIVPALIAAAPAMGSECSFAKRAGIGLIGGVIGAAFGGVAGAALNDYGPGVIVGYVGGAGVGAALGSGLCK